MYGLLTNRDETIKHHVVYVPDNIAVAKVEILTFRGAPAFLGTRLAKLYFEDNSIILCSQMSGVVNRILVDNDQLVSCGQELFELRNANTVRDKSRHKKNPAKSPLSNPTTLFFKLKEGSFHEISDFSHKEALNFLHNKI